MIKVDESEDPCHRCKSVPHTGDEDLAITRHRRLARSAAAHNSKNRSGGHAKREAIQRRRDGTGITEAYIFECDRTRQRRCNPSSVSSFFRFLIRDFRDNPNSPVCLIELLNQVRKLNQWLSYALSQNAECHQCAEIDWISGCNRSIGRKCYHATGHQFFEGRDHRLRGVARASPLLGGAGRLRPRGDPMLGVGVAPMQAT